MPAGPRSPTRRASAGWSLFAARPGLAILAALVSPIDGLGDQLMLMHMVQHILLLDIAPILLILGLTKGLLRPVTRRLTRIERRAGLFAHPAFAVVAYAGLMWLWHIPAHVRPGAAQRVDPRARARLLRRRRLALLVAPALADPQPHAASAASARSLYMVSTKLLVGILGIVLAFAPELDLPLLRPPPPLLGPQPPRGPEHRRACVMALEQSIVMGIALVWLFVRMLTESEREAQRAERFEVA